MSGASRPGARLRPFPGARVTTTVGQDLGQQEAASWCMLCSPSLWERLFCVHRTSLPVALGSLRSAGGVSVQLMLDTPGFVQGGKQTEQWVWNVTCYLMEQNAGLDEAQSGIKFGGRNITNLRYAVTHPYFRKQRGTREPLDESERGG